MGSGGPERMRQTFGCRISGSRLPANAYFNPTTRRPHNCLTEQLVPLALFRRSCFCGTGELRQPNSLILADRDRTGWTRQARLFAGDRLFDITDLELDLLTDPSRNKRHACRDRPRHRRLKRNPDLAR